jgi:hypothetical protein
MFSHYKQENNNFMSKTLLQTWDKRILNNVASLVFPGIYFPQLIIVQMLINYLDVADILTDLLSSILCA